MTNPSDSSKKTEADSSKKTEESKKTEDISYNFFYWGPILFKTKLRSEDLEKCAKLCNKKSTPFNNNLAGVIKHEHEVNAAKLDAILEPYVNAFRLAYLQWYGEMLIDKIITFKAWANFMVAGEFNPPHRHDKCDFSSVLFVKIPETLKEENKNFKGTGAGPGSISFTYGDARSFSITSKDFFPEEGEFFIFPADLTHFVPPFLSKGERISLSANFRLIHV